jgi:sugar transferase (PEP-CTERM system associated)
MLPRMARMISAPALGAARALFLLDLAVTALAWPVALALLADPPRADSWQGVLALLLYPAAYLVGLYSLGLYRRDALNEPRQALGRVPVAAALAALGASAVLALLTEGSSVALFAVATIGLGVAGCIARLALAALRRLGLFRRRLLIVGAGQRAWDLVWLLRREARTLAFDIALLHEPAMGEFDARLAEDPALRIFPAGTDFLDAARGFGADQIIVASDERRGLPMQALLACRTAGFPVSEYLRSLEREIGRIDIKRLELGFLVYDEGFGASLLDHALKRALDIVASLLLLALSSPFLIAATLAVKLQDGGPALYRQARVTRDGRVFRIMKLRTMRVDAERFGATWAAERDPRITRVGHFLRRTRLDELPQLFNVLRGDMSIVGPRPERPEFTQELARKLPLYEERHRMRAGLTGWAQVNYPYGASLDDARSKLSYDLYYVKNFGVLFDLLILMQTLRVVLFPGNAVR